MPSEVSGPISIVNLYRFNTQKVLENVGNKSIIAAGFTECQVLTSQMEDERGRGR